MIIRPKSYDRGNIYLSGGMQFAKDLGGAWRKLCADELIKMQYFPLDITALDVAYGKDHGELFTLTDRSKPLHFKSDFRKHFIQTDLNLIQYMTDALIVYYDESVRKGAGTISECQYAYNLNMPIFLVSAYEDMLSEVPGWLQGLTTKMFSNFEELYSYLNDIPYGILKKDMYGNHHVKGKYLCSMCGDIFDKNGSNFVSQVTPLYCKPCVNIVSETNSSHADRYEFFVKHLYSGQQFDMDCNGKPHKHG